MRLFELLQQPYPWQITHRDDGVYAQFVSKAGHCNVKLVDLFHDEPHEESLWCLTFSVNGSYGITGTGDAFRIFATVIEIAKKMVAMERPSHFVFTAWPEDASRVKLYKRLAATIGNGTNYDFEMIDAGIEVRFEYKRRDAQ